MTPGRLRGDSLRGGARVAVTYVSSDLPPALRDHPIEMVNVDWERFVPPARPVDLVVESWDKPRSHGAATVGHSPSTRVTPARRDST